MTTRGSHDALGNVEWWREAATLVMLAASVALTWLAGAHRDVREGELVLDQPGFEGAKFVCSPPLRPKDHQEELWAGLRQGDLQIVAAVSGS